MSVCLPGRYSPNRSSTWWAAVYLDNPILMDPVRFRLPSLVARLVLMSRHRPLLPDTIV